MKRILNKIGKFFKWVWLFFVDFIKSLWRILIGLKTPKGIIALLISLMIYYGWAVGLVVIGSIFPSHRWMIGVGTGVMLFWAGPFTPFWPITLVTTIFIQRYILRDKKAQSFQEIYEKYLADRQMSKEDERFMKHFNKNKEKKDDKNRKPDDQV